MAPDPTDSLCQRLLRRGHSYHGAWTVSPGSPTKPRLRHRVLRSRHSRRLARISRDHPPRCDECGTVAGTIRQGHPEDLVTPALATEMDKFVPDAEHIDGLPGPLR